MKKFTKIKREIIAVVMVLIFLSANLQFTFAQKNQTPDRTRTVQIRNKVELLKPQNPNEADLLAVSVTEDQLFVGGRNGSLRYFEIYQDGKIGQPFDLPKYQVASPVRQVFFKSNIGYSLRGNTLYSTKNGTWSGNYVQQIVGGLIPEFWGMDFADPSSACIVGVNLKKSGNKDVVDSGLVICNHDFRTNSKAWIQPTLPDEFQNKSIDSQLTSISFQNNNGWLVGASGIIWKTENGGKKWQAEDSKTQNPLLGVYTVSENDVWAVGFNSTILHRSKNKVTVPQPEKNKRNEKNSKGKNNSENDPQNEEKEPATLKDKAQQKVNEIKDGVETLRNTIITTKTEQKENDEQKPDKEKDKKTDKNNDAKKENETVKNEEAEQFESTKGEWAALEDNPIGALNVRLWSVKFSRSNPQNGWIVGDSGIILSTNDGGKTWEKVSLVNAQGVALFKNTAPNFYALSVDDNYCWVVGNQGVILRLSY